MSELVISWRFLIYFYHSFMFLTFYTVYHIRFICQMINQRSCSCSRQLNIQSEPYWKYSLQIQLGKIRSSSNPKRKWLVFILVIWSNINKSKWINEINRNSPGMARKKNRKILCVALCHRQIDTRFKLSLKFYNCDGQK